MEVLVLVLVVILALAAIASGVWVAIALVRAICPPRTPQSQPDAQGPAGRKAPD